MKTKNNLFDVYEIPKKVLSLVYVKLGFRRDSRPDLQDPGCYGLFAQEKPPLLTHPTRK